MSIATKKGDGGETSLPGGRRVSKSDLRIEGYGAIDELISSLGFSRAVSSHADIAGAIKAIQQDLFRVAAVIGTPSDAPAPPEVTVEMVEVLDRQVHDIEALPGILNDWSLPGELFESSALDLSRTVCRRAERLSVALADAGILQSRPVLAYLNRLSDLLWLFGRLAETRAGIDTSLRPKTEPGKPWSRAW